MTETRPGMQPDAPSVDVTGCDREPIHLLGAIQPFGALFAFSSDWILVHASANTVEAMGRAPEDLLGLPAAEFVRTEALHAIRARLQWLTVSGGAERLFALDLFGQEARYDVAIHMSGETIVVEVERCDGVDRIEAISVVRNMMARLRQAEDHADFLDRAARQVRAVTGYDRVMVYRFLDDGAGEVVAEARNKRAQSFLGLRYPASDIPVQARELYKRNVFRIIADVDAPRVPIVPPRSPEGEPLDLSLAVLRAVSEIHLEYLRNMEVAASLSISILQDGRLWGLFACHNLTPRDLSLDRRTAAELFAELFGLELANRSRQRSLEHEAEARQMHDRIMSTMHTDGSALDNLRAHLPGFLKVMAADGCGVWVDGEYALTGCGLTSEEAHGLVRFLNRSGPSRIYATASLAKYFPEALDYAERVSGVLAIPVARTPRDYLIFFRREIAQSVNWAGNPTKAVTAGANGSRLTPRRSFETYREIVRQQSAPWTPRELAIAETVRTTLLEVILRSVDRSAKLLAAAKETQDLLVAELNHRVRNILSLIRNVVHQTGERATSVTGFATTLGGRIHALAQAHDQLTTQRWGPTAVRTLFANELDAYAGETAGRVTLDGPDVALMPEAYTSLALVIHEMATNSVKYGSMSDRRGRLEIGWQLDAAGALAIRWQEIGGPPVQAPARRGFGSALIERAVPFELGGEASVEFAPGGVVGRFLVPDRFVRDLAPGPAPAAAPKVERAQLVPSDLTVLLVEDNLVIAMDAEAMLEELGFAEIKVANSAGAGVRIVEAGGVSCALLDVNLGRDTSIPVAQALAARGIPFVFASGYGDPELLPEAFRKVTVLTKPYGEKRVLEALTDAIAASA